MLSLNNRLRGLLPPQPYLTVKPVTRKIVLGLAFFALLLIILSADFIPDKVSFEVGQVSDRDVVAPRTISYVDQAKTKKLEMEVLASVANVYDLEVAVATNANDNVTTIFQLAGRVAADNKLTFEQKTAALQGELPFTLPGTAIAGLASLDETALNLCEEYTKQILSKYFQRGIRDDDLDIARKHVVIQAEELGLSHYAEAVVAGISQTLLKPNFILNVRETDTRKQAALASIDPVRETVKKGQVLVRRGDVVTSDQIRAMEELGLHKGQVNELRVLGLAVFVLVVMGVSIAYLYKFADSILDNDLHLVLLALITLVTLALGKVAHYYSDFAAPLAAGALLTAILIDTRVGLLVSVILALLFGVIVDHDLRAVTVALVGGMTGVYSVSKLIHGYSFTKSGLWIAATNFLVICATGFVEQLTGIHILMQGLMGIVSGIATAVITTGLLPYLEHTFNITTPIKLLDIARPNHPLLQRLLLEAPGTYHHSVLVGNLAETAASMVGADPVTVRVGAYYHDIGKIKRPMFFIENQVGPENPHDKIAPSLSTLIVTSHIKDGLDLCREFKIPRPVTDIIQQHHGTTLVSFFYNRATENEHSECIIEADFRYEGPTPQSKEAALVMLADACEAAVRSIAKPNVNRIEAMVRKLIKQRLDDGQLNDCNLTLKDLNTIGDVYIRVLSSMFHNRIEYPDSLRELEKRKSKSGNPNKQCTGKDDSSPACGTNDNGCPNKSS